MLNSLKKPSHQKVNKYSSNCRYYFTSAKVKYLGVQPQTQIQTNLIELLRQTALTSNVSIGMILLNFVKEINENKDVTNFVDYF